MALVRAGLAAFTGVAGTVTVSALLVPITQSARFNHSFDEEIISNAAGEHASWIARNDKYEGDLDLRLAGGTALATLQAGIVMLTPFVKVTLAGFGAGAGNGDVNGDYQYIGETIDLKNVEVGSMSLKLRHYTDAAIQTASTTTPT
jgi:hypothetical protein